MLRLGAVSALDVDDYDEDEQYLAVRHRPETETPLKNQGDGERYVALSGRMCDLLDGWIEARRPAVVDETGREPLLASASGRAAKSTLRMYVYQYTRPCVYGDRCPHDRSADECEAMDYGRASSCPSSVSPHAVRRGGITHRLRSDVPETVVSDRADVSQGVIDQHYDCRDEREKMEQRRAFFDTF